MAPSLNQVRCLLYPRSHLSAREGNTVPKPRSILLGLTLVMLALGTLAKALTLIFTAT
ncbi:hypothetical protein [Tianweitania populi]|uniref:hypothetical protein n=1 Tax=Tianweitania populi TaxID=1607949 RepID=UPI001679C4C4|nr:hypothetical protein [Tianweitania populi]